MEAQLFKSKINPELVIKVIARNDEYVTYILPDKKNQIEFRMSVKTFEEEYTKVN